jgi:hypothetical protein
MFEGLGTRFFDTETVENRGSLPDLEFLFAAKSRNRKIHSRSLRRKKKELSSISRGFIRLALAVTHAMAEHWSPQPPRNVARRLG